jgi:hypothetical protein
MSRNTKNLVSANAAVASTVVSSSESSAQGLQTIDGVNFFEGLPVAVYDVSRDIDAIVTDNGTENGKGEFERVLCLRKGGRVLLTTKVTDDQVHEFLDALIEGYGSITNLETGMQVKLQYVESAIRTCKMALDSLRRDIDRSNLTAEEQKELDRSIRRAKRDYKKGLAKRDGIMQALHKVNPWLCYLIAER